MNGNEKIDELMIPVLKAIKRYVKDQGAITDIYNRAYEAVMVSLDANELSEKRIDAAGDLLESISTWFYKRAGMESPSWADQYKSVCQLFEPMSQPPEVERCSQIIA